MTAKTFLAVGEAKIEMSGGGEDRRFRMGFAGDTMNTAWYARALLDDGWVDRYSQAMRSFLEESSIDTAHVGPVVERQPGLYLIHQEDGDRHFTYWRELVESSLSNALMLTVLSGTILGHSKRAADSLGAFSEDNLETNVDHPFLRIFSSNALQ